MSKHFISIKESILFDCSFFLLHLDFNIFVHAMLIPNIIHIIFIISSSINKIESKNYSLSNFNISPMPRENNFEGLKSKFAMFLVMFF